MSISLKTAGGSGQDIEGEIGIDNVLNTQGTAHRFIGTATDIGNMGGTAILDLAVNKVVSLMMINTMDTMDKVYIQKEDFWAKYGILMGIGAVVVLAIVVIYLSYEYGQFVVQQTLDAASKTGGMMEAIYDKLGGGSATPS